MKQGPPKTSDKGLITWNAGADSEGVLGGSMEPQNFIFIENFG